MSNQITLVASADISPSILPSSSALEASSRLSIHASVPRTCNSNRSTPLLIWKHTNSPMQTCILSSRHVSPRHREQQLHQPPHSYVVIADPVIASDSRSDQPVAASLSAMHHGMFTLQVNCPPAIVNCPLCAPRTVRPSLSITGRPQRAAPPRPCQPALDSADPEHPLNSHRTPISCHVHYN
jgi:hypothetical protein